VLEEVQVGLTCFDVALVLSRSVRSDTECPARRQVSSATFNPVRRQVSSATFSVRRDAECQAQYIQGVRHDDFELHHVTHNTYPSYNLHGSPSNTVNRLSSFY
jgi:hypothetical protein